MRRIINSSQKKMSSPFDVKIYVAFPHTRCRKSLLAWIEYASTLQGKRNMVVVTQPLLEENELEYFITPTSDIVVLLETRQDFVRLTQSVLFDLSTFNNVRIHYAPQN